MATSPRPVQSLRSNTALARPPNSNPPGSLYSNWPDRQIGVLDSSSNPMDLVAVRFFSPLTSYVVGDHVANGGYLYRAKVAVPIGAWNAANWDQLATTTTTLSYLPLAGGTVTGDIVLPGTAPGQALAAVPKSYVDNAVAAIPPGGAAMGTAPATPFNGQLWWDTTGGQLYVSYNDGTSTQWVAATNPGAPSITVAPAPPTSPALGNLWWDTVGGQLYVWYNDGTSSQWVVANNIAGAYLPTAGGTLTGPLTFAANQTPWPKPIVGVTDGSNAAAGQVGELLSINNIASPSAVSTSAWQSPVPGLPVTAGDWDVDGLVQFLPSATNVTNIYAGFSTTVNVNPNVGPICSLTTSGALNQCSLTLPNTRFSLAATTNIYINTQIIFPSGTCTAGGYVRARRMR